MVHKPKHKVHSFRGLLGDGGQDEINLERQNVNLAYRIVKFQVISNVTLSATATVDHVVKVWREEQTSIPTGSAVIDLTDPDLLAVGVYAQGQSLEYTNVIVFDNILFSRNIYVTATDNDGTDSVNYYLELEEVPVGAATLMQIKLGTARKLIGGSMGK